MLYIISTPIGNLSDISLRASDTLKKCSLILAEDSRISRKLLDFLGIKDKKIVSFYDDIEEKKIPEIIRFLEDDMNIALISDAGTPLLSDPGYQLIKKCQQKNLAFTAVPGPSAIINALVLSGLRVDKFCFVGFMPKKISKRKEKLQNIKSFDGSKIVFESARRLVDLLETIEELYGSDCQVAVCREMTKIYEKVTRGRVDQVKDMVKLANGRGEVTVVFI